MIIRLIYLFLLEIHISTWDLTEPCWWTSENRAGCSSRARGEVLRSLQCSCLLRSCITAPNYPENLWRLFAETDTSSQQHFCTWFCVAQRCQVKQLHTVFNCPNSQWEKWYKHWKTFWQLPAPLTGLHSTRKNRQLFPGCITAKITTLKCGGTIHTTIHPCHKTNSTITWSKLLKTSNRISRNWD